MPGEKGILGKIFHPHSAVVCFDEPEAMAVSLQADSNRVRQLILLKKAHILESNQPGLCGLLGAVFLRKQFPNSLSSLELSFQIIAICAFDNVTKSKS